MNKLLTYTPELFPELDPEAEEEVRGRRRSRALPPSFRGKPKASIPRLRPMPLPRLIPIVSPLWRPPRDTGWPDDNRRTDQAGSQGSGEPANTQSGEPPSEYVRWVQDSLNRALGLQLPIDGIMNRETRSAVRSFQERRGLPINGLVGPETEAALKAASSLAPAQTPAPKPEAEWETPSLASGNCSSCNGRTSMDYELGFEAEPFAGARTFNEFEAEDMEVLEEWKGETAQESSQRVRWIQESLNKILGLRLKVDGIMGPQTRSAIRSFQAARGLGADGIVGPKTQAAMNAALGGVQVPPQAKPPYTTPALLTPPAGQGTQRTVYGWSQYKRRVEDLPPDQKAILKGIGDAIIASHQPGRQPVQTVQVYGHADQDTPPNAKREQQMSDERAQQVTDWLKAHVGDSIARRIAWDTKGFGATQLKASLENERNRRKNRRVEITLVRTGLIRCCGCSTTGERDYSAWLRRSLNQVMGFRLPVSGRVDAQTRSAVRALQVRAGLPQTGTINAVTYQRILASGASAAPCVPADPFPAAYPVVLLPNPDLQFQAKLNTAIANSALKATPDFAIQIVELKQGGSPDTWAGQNHTVMHFSASLIKVAAIYAAYELRAAANRLAVMIGAKTDRELFDALNNCLTPQILAYQMQATKCQGQGEDKKILNASHLKPTYRQVLVASQTAAGFCAEFQMRYDRELSSIVSDPGANGHANFCIHGLGYNYIAGALEKAGFFDRTKQSGIWLAGDYLRQWPYMCVNSTNDGLVAQATTAYDMAQLFTSLWKGVLFKDPCHPSASSEMLLRLAFPRGAGRPSWIKEGNLRAHDVTHSKIGVAGLKKGGKVYSEGCILESKTSDRRFVVVWQNYPANMESRFGFQPIAQVVEESVR